MPSLAFSLRASLTLFASSQKSILDFCRTTLFYFSGSHPALLLTQKAPFGAFCFCSLASVVVEFCQLDVVVLDQRVDRVRFTGRQPAKESCPSRRLS